MPPSIPRTPLGDTGIRVPRLVFGTSALGNLYGELPAPTREALVAEWFENIDPPVCIDSAGKYGAGLALERIGELLARRQTDPADIVISNKLGWKRVPLSGAEPTFEPGVWENLGHDAVQRIDYDGMFECFEQGNALLGGRYKTQLASVHDPDEYLHSSQSAAERDRRFGQVIDAYRALGELKSSGRIAAVGIGAKDWHVIREIVHRVGLDWVMLATSWTIYSHPEELRRFMAELEDAGVFVINSAVFHSGFLAGGSYFDYRPVSPSRDRELFAWREEFFGICSRFDVRPVDACVEFGLAPGAVKAIAMNSSKPERIAENVRSVNERAPREFWRALATSGLISTTPEQLEE